MLALSVWAQQPEHRDDKYQNDPHAFCRRGPEDAGDPSAHSCACAMVCAPDANGRAVQQETSSCSMYCSKQRCTCHADEACEESTL
jgi:hypothetical protein